jgi:PAS domain-containing protein
LVIEFGRQPGQSAMTILKQLPAVVVLERIPVPVLAIAQDGTVLFANTAFSEMVGRASEEVLSLKFDEIFHLAPAPNRPSRSSRHWRTWSSSWPTRTAQVCEH